MSFPRQLMAQGPESVTPDKLYLVKATIDGTPPGAFEITGNYAARTEFWVVVPPGKVYYANALDVYIQGAGAITANGYGPIGALANGIEISFRDPFNVPIAPPVTITNTGLWQSIPGVTLQKEEAGPGDNYLNVTWNFAQTANTAVALGAGTRITIVAHDDFTGLTSHFMTVSGFLLDES